MRTPKGLVIPRSSDEPLADRLTTGDAHEARHRPPAVVRPSGRRACAARPAAASFERETNASGGAEMDAVGRPRSREALPTCATATPD